MIDYKAARFEDRVQSVDMVFDLVGGETQERLAQGHLRGKMVLTPGAGPPPHGLRLLS